MTEIRLTVDIKQPKITPYTKKIRENPEFYAKEKIRTREYNKARYNSDPEYAEKLKARRREYYNRTKQTK